jgi:hypothetical protein
MILKLLASRPSLLPHPELTTKGPVMPVPRMVVHASLMLKWVLRAANPITGVPCASWTTGRRARGPRSQERMYR